MLCTECDHNHGCFQAYDDGNYAAVKLLMTWDFHAVLYIHHFKLFISLSHHATM